MFNTKNMTEASLLSAFAVILQVIPVLLSDVFTLFTMLSTIPIFLVTKKYSKLGVMSYCVTTLLILLFSVQESMIFLFLNGLIGLSLGLISNSTHNKWLVRLIAGVTLSISIYFVNFMIGIPLFGVRMKPSLLILLFIGIFSFLYCSIYYCLLTVLIRRISILQKYLSK